MINIGGLRFLLFVRSHHQNVLQLDVTFSETVVGHKCQLDNSAFSSAQYGVAAWRQQEPNAAISLSIGIERMFAPCGSSGNIKVVVSINHLDRKPVRQAQVELYQCNLIIRIRQVNHHLLRLACLDGEILNWQACSSGSSCNSPWVVFPQNDVDQCHIVCTVHLSVTVHIGWCFFRTLAKDDVCQGY